MKTKERLSKFLTKVNQVGYFKKLPPAWRGAIVGTLIASLSLFSYKPLSS